MTETQLWKYINDIEAEADLTPVETALINRIAKDTEESIPISLPDFQVLRRIWGIKTEAGRKAE